MYIIIDTIVLIILLLTVIICGDELAKALGGSLIFSLFLPVIYIVSYIYKKYHTALSAAGIIVLTLLLTNYLDYLDKVNKIPFTWIVVMYFSTSLAGIVAFIFLAFRPLRPNLNTNIKAENIVMKKRIYERLALFPILGLVIFSISTALPYFILGIADDKFLDKGLISYIHICTFWLALSFSVTLISLWKIKEKISFLIIENSKIKFKNYNTLFFFGLGLLIIDRKSHV